MTDVGVGERLRRLEDRLAIGELLADYNYALDRGLAAMFRSLWADDGVWEFQAPLGRYVGIERIMAAWSEIRAQTPDVHHLTADIVVVRLDDTEAEVRSDGLAQAGPGGGSERVTMFCHFEDRLRKIDGRWRFLERFVHFYADAVVEITDPLR